ncbi:hypothetical protein KY314_01735 [Candidatus Woesearchaeota archaeon]|nr:hypothetical protein [Candidatus Woesearchaeota archaeon]
MLKEKRVYVIECRHNFDFRKEEQKGNLEAIMSEAEKRGSVYSLQGFQDAINNEELVLTNSFILIN